ncbi:MAG: lycopene cyclase domain-containing protein [Acidimicrobiales bacterium]
MPEYTVAAAGAVVVVVLLEVTWLRTGLLRTAAYWLAMAINLFFMVLVDGWLTKLSAPIVLYDADATSSWRFPWDIPVEDFAFGFALLTLVMLLWDRAGPARPVDAERRRGPRPDRP